MTVPHRKYTLIACRHPATTDLGDGDYDLHPLSEMGREQAVSVAKRLRDLIPQGVTPLVLHQLQAARTIEEALVIAGLFRTGVRPAIWLTEGPQNLGDLTRFTEYATAGTVIACGGQPALRRLLQLAQRDPGMSLPPGIVLKFEVDDSGIRYIETIAVE